MKLNKLYILLALCSTGLAANAWRPSGNYATKEECEKNCSRGTCTTPLPPKPSLINGRLVDISVGVAVPEGWTCYVAN